MRKDIKLIIEMLKTSNGCINVTAQKLNLHRTTVWRWKKKGTSLYGNLYWRGLKRKSTRPHIIHRIITSNDESAIITLKKTHGHTAEKIKHLLVLPYARNTIHRFLKRKGLVQKYGYHRRPKLQDTIHMHLKNTMTIGKLQMDVKYITPELSGLPYTCFEYAVIDIYSRYKEAIILNHLDQDGAILALMEILNRLPFSPDFIQTDNGLEFQGRFHAFCEERKLKHHMIHKSTPNENAVIERTFRTDEEEFFFYMKRAPKDYDELRVWFADFLYYYNYKRPHLGINLRTPYEVIRLLQMS